MVKATDEQILASARGRIRELHEAAPDSIGDRFCFQAISCTGGGREILFQCKTLDWMRNAFGTLHGGMCAAVVDQAMGFAAYCVKPGEGITPTVQMQVEYHSPLSPGKDIFVRVQVVSTGKTLMHLAAQAWQADREEQLCLSATGLYFYKPMKADPPEPKKFC